MTFIKFSYLMISVALISCSNNENEKAKVGFQINNEQIQNQIEDSLYLGKSNLIISISKEIYKFVDSFGNNSNRNLMRNIIYVELKTNRKDTIIDMFNSYCYDSKRNCFIIKDFLIVFKNLNHIEGFDDSKLVNNKVPEKFKAKDSIKPFPFESTYKTFRIVNNSNLKLIDVGMR